MGESHLDALAFAARLLESLRLGERPSDVAGTLIDTSRDLSDGCVRTALRLQSARRAVPFAPAIEERGAVINDGAAGCQGLVGGAGISVGIFIVPEIGAREGPIFALRPIEDGDVRGNPLL